MKKTLTIIAAVVVGLGILGAIYFLFFYQQGPSLTADTSGNPFGEPAGQTTGAGSIGGDLTPADTGNNPSQVAPKLIEVSSTPVGKGFIVLDATTTGAVSLSSTTPDAAPSTGTEVLYIDRESGNMYAYSSARNASTRLTNRTVPGVAEASWLPDGSAAYVRFLSGATDGNERIETYRLPADGSDGSFLAEGLSSVSVTSGPRVFTLAPNASGSVGYVANADGSSPVTLFSSLLSSLAVHTSAGTMVAYTKPSANLAGYAFLVDTKSGAFSSILGPLPGLTALPSPSGATILVSYLDQGAVRLGFYDVKTHVTTSLPVATFTDKCVWAADSSALYCAVPTTLPSVALPDSWYQGTVAFTDRIWKIDFAARVATLVADLPTLTNTPIDAVGLATDPAESTLVFMNKADGSFWAYNL
jgi:hypothetical protein